MSDPEVPKNEHDVDDVVGRANEGLDAAAAARADVSGTDAGTAPVDPDEEAFAAAERDHPGTFSAGESGATDETSATPATMPEHDAPLVSESDSALDDAPSAYAENHSRAESTSPWHEASSAPQGLDAGRTDDETKVIDAERPYHPTVADTAYATAPAAETQVLPAEPVAPPVAPQPIFVQAPEPPRELGNRGAAGGIGLVATLAFAVLYLGAMLGLGALGGEVTAENVGTAALAALTTWAFWVPVVVFFLAFWLLGAFLNRARWGKWVTLGLLVAVATYGGHILGQLFQAPFWRINATQTAELVGAQLLAPLAIAAFIFARELTIWFGAWVARSGAKKKVLNAEAQAEYERTLEAGPAALR